MWKDFQALLKKIRDDFRVALAVLADKFIAFVKGLAGLALAAALLGLLLWFAIISKYAGAVVELLKALTAPALVVGGVVVWFVTRFKEEIRLLLLRMSEAGPFKFRGLSEEEVKQLSGGLMTGSIPPGASLGEIWEKAQAGSVKEQFQLGLVFYLGKGVQIDRGESARWFRRAAEQGRAGAQYNLGRMYCSGLGVAEDDAEAAKWFRRAAEQGLAKAQFNLGLAYDKGKGVPQDGAEAAKWFRRAAEQEHAQAQYWLGMAYDEGKGVSRDDAEAAKWYRRAAEQGIPQAKYALERLRQGGDGKK